MAIAEFPISSKKMREINEIAKKCTTLFPSWKNFVEESIDLTLDFWGKEPGLAISKGMAWFPHYTEDMKNAIRARPEEGGFGEENYQRALVNASKEWYKKNAVLELGREIHDDELDDFPNKLKLRNMEFIPEPHTPFLAGSGRMREINDIVTKNSYFKSAEHFFDESLDLTVTWWSNPTQASEKFFEWFGGMSDVQHEVMREHDEKMYNEFTDQYWNWKKQKEEVDKKLQPQSPHTSQKEKFVEFAAIPTRSERLQYQSDISDEAAGQIADLCENLEELYTTTRDIRDIDRKELSDAKENKETGEIEGRLPYDEYPLIWEFYSRFFPVKVVISELAYMLAEKESTMVDYNDFRERAYYTALGLSEKIREYESKKGRKRNEKISAGLPQPPVDERFLKQQTIDEKKAKFYSSKLRFQEHFIGMSEEAWVKKQNLSGKDLEKKQDKNAKPIKNKNGIAFFDGALNAMGLVNFVAEKKGDKKKSGDHTYRIKVGLSEKGTKFFLERNPVLLNYNGIATQRYHPTSALNPSEADFIKKEIIPRFPLEKMIIEKIEGEMVGKKMYAGGKGGIEYHIQNIFRMWKEKYDSNGEHAYHKVLENVAILILKIHQMLLLGELQLWEGCQKWV